MGNLEDQKYNVICLANQLWDFPNWTNKKHVMTRLAKLGHNVLFVDPPINTGRVFARQISRGLWGISRMLTQRKKDPSGVWVYTPLNVVPFSEVTAPIHVESVKKLSKKLFDPDRKTVLWVYHVEIAQIEKYLSGLNYDLLVYDCVDNYESFPRYAISGEKERIRNQEKLLAEKANIVFATTPLLVEKLKKFNPHIFFTPNAGDYEKFEGAKSLKDQLPQDLKDISRPRIGFAGALDEYKFDGKLMRRIAQDHPKFSFVLIGQVALKDRNAGLEELGLSGIDNIYFLGAKPYEILEKYYGGFDAYIIPYQLNDYTVGGCFPVKFHDALAAGLPIIVTDLPSYAPFKDACYVSRDYEEFSANVKRALEEDNDERIRARQEVAKKNSWDGKVAKMLEYIHEALPN